MSNYLKLGDTGSAVVATQSKLITLGFALDIPYFGTYDAQTEAGVRAFQAARGLAVDGIVGPATASALGVSLPLQDRPADAPSAPPIDTGAPPVLRDNGSGGGGMLVVGLIAAAFLLSRR